MMFKRAVAAAISALCLFACSGDVEESPRAAGNADSTSDAAICLQGDAFIAEGDAPLDADEPGTAHEISGLRWEMHDGCGRFVVDVAEQDGSPAASVSKVRAEVLRELGIVRIHLREVEQVRPEATEASFSGLARGAYSVRSGEGRWVYVDLHLADEAEVHVDVLDDPGRVVVDLRPGGPAIPPPPAVHQRVVVLEPRGGRQSYPLTITGYARTFEANVVARIEQGGEEVEETFTTATAWAEAWGHFSMTIEQGLPGPTTLHVGEYSARDGSWEGVAIDLEMQ